MHNPVIYPRALLLQCFLQLLSLTCDAATTWSAETEHNVRATLFNSSVYHRLVRPQQQTEVNIALNLITINEVDMGKQTISMTGWLTVEWIDSRLNWTVTDGVDHVYAMDSEIWKPELIIDNSLSDVSILHDENLLFRVKHTGKVDWEFPMMFLTHCDIDTTFYPFDTQKCPIEITTWAYTIDELYLKHLKTEVNIEDLKRNGEWIYLSSSLEVKELTEHNSDHGVDKYSQLVFNVVIERRPDFYVTNVVLPILLMSFLNVLVYYLPAESGEKISYSLTVLLALAVFLTLIADSMPHTSVNTAVLSVYLTFTLCMGVICVIFSVIILKIHFMESGCPPILIQRLTEKILVPGGCWNGCGCCSQCKKKGSQSSVSQVAPFRITKEEIKMTSENHDDDRDSINLGYTYTWKEVATILDRFLLTTSLSLTILATVVFMICLRVGGTLQAHKF